MDVLEETLNAWNGTPVPACVYMCACTHLGSGGPGGAGRVATVCCAGVYSGIQVPGPLPCRKPACTSDGFHVKPQRTDLSYRAPTPDHTQHRSIL